MKALVKLAVLEIGAVLLVVMPVAVAHAQLRGPVVVPQSGIERPGDVGVKAHTDVLLVPISGSRNVAATVHSQTTSAPPLAGFYFDTPASIACAYELDSQVRGFCNPNTATENPSGGSRAIAVVDAYDDPFAAADLAEFSRQFALPAAKFTVVFARGFRPPVDPTGGWEFEESLDIEWSHALAPNAAIYLVEAASSSLSDLLLAESVAGGIVGNQGGGEVSNGWGSSEFSGELGLDRFFTSPGVVYLAASGDAPGIEYPAASPNVIAAGGTSLNRDVPAATLNESAWQDSGGGPSAFEPRPSYQSAIASTVGDARGTPDVSVTANPNSGVWVYDTVPVELSAGFPTQFAAGWIVAGGTSVSTTMLAGMINSRGDFASTSAQELTTVYGNLGSANFFDIAIGNCGPYGGYAAVAGWDFCTGVGSPAGAGGF